MPITIWEPARYAEGFANNAYNYPANGSNAAAPYNRDTKVCEIPRFTGWKQVYFCDTGEFEITTQQITPEQAQRGYMVEIDGDMFVIEDVTWELGEGGYTCTLGGRDFWAFAERQISRRWVGNAYFVGDGGSTLFSGSALRFEVSRFFWYLDQNAGWWRDKRRFPQVSGGLNNLDEIYPELVLIEFNSENSEQGFLYGDVGVQNCREIMPFASEWRLFCSWFGVGLRFGFEWQDEAGVYAIKPTIYEGRDMGIIINTSDRGVSDFRFSESSRTDVNAVFMAWDSKAWRYAGSGDVSKVYKADNLTGTTLANTLEESVSCVSTILAEDDAANYPERAIAFSEKFLSMGQVPDENDAEADSMKAWAKETAKGELKASEKEFSFRYTNEGAYRYGEHFTIGDKITIQDYFLGVQSSQRLTGVKTTYGEDELGYDFEFSNQRISQNETLKRKFAEIDRRTFGRAKRV